jgi:hypothetical protein
MATGLSLSSTSNLSSGQKILVANAKMAFEPAAPNPDLVDVQRIPQGHKQWDVLSWARFGNASALTEGVDLAQSEQLVTASLSITPAEHGIIATISKRLIRRQGDADAAAASGRMLAASLRRRMDLDVIALYDVFTKTSPGTTQTLDITHFRGSVAYLMTDNSSTYGPAPMPIHAALHIEQISDIINDLTDISGTATSNAPFAAGLSAEMVQRWWRGSDRLYGVPIFHGGNIERNSLDDSKGAIFNKESMVLVMANEAEVTEQDDKSLRAIEYGIFQEWSEAQRVDEHGIEIHSDTASSIT